MSEMKTTAAIFFTNMVCNADYINNVQSILLIRVI
jgi:hypothetical protein